MYTCDEDEFTRCLRYQPFLEETGSSAFDGIQLSINLISTVNCHINNRIARHDEQHLVCILQ